MLYRKGSNLNCFTKNEKVFVVLLSIFIASLTISSVLVNKIINVFGFFVPAGILGYSVTFIITDSIHEIWGKERANFVVIGGFIALFFVFLLVMLSIYWPKAPFWDHDSAYQLILGSTPRIIIASFVAYLFSQFHDVWAFHLLKRIFKKKHLWLRNNISTVISQFIDTTLFITIAFYGVMPIIPMIFAQWFIKCIIAILDTPIVYLMVWYMRDKPGISIVEKKPDFK